MGRLIDLTGQVFGKLTVLEQDKEKSKEQRRACWKCQCECGKIISVRGDSLRNGITISCGGHKIKDLTGQQYGYLEVLELDKEKSGRNAYWLCKCHGCGKIVSIESRNLQYHMQSCGCKRYDIISEKNSAHLEGQVFGHLKVLERDTFKPRGTDAYWICQCGKCGSLCSIRSYDLLSEKTRTCGCVLSKGEDKIVEILKFLKITFVPQKTFSDLKGEVYPLRFDFFLPDYNLLIEYQGKQHYSAQKYFGGEEKFNQQQEYDNKKREYCLQNHLNLVEIPYWDYDNLDAQYILNKLNDLKLKEAGDTNE